MTKQVQGDPMLVTCAACYSKPGERCTTPTNDGQRPVQWFHLVREGDARVSFNDIEDAR